MANVGFRVPISRKAPEMILLGENIIIKHEADGAGSVLSVIDMPDMKIKVVDARAKNTAALQLNRDKELAYEQRDLALGIYTGQEPSMPGTVIYYIMSARDILLGVYKESKHILGDFGFEITRGGASVKIPRKASEMIVLALNILAKDTELGVNSPLKGMDIADFTTKTNTANTKNTLALELNRQKENTFLLRDRILGIEKKQKQGSQGTVLFYISCVRDVLLGLFKKTESQLGLWGFDVQYGPTPPSGKKLLTGIVSDMAGVVIPGAILTLTPGSASVNSNNSGVYSFTSIPAGTYSMQVIKSGYDTVVINNIKIEEGTTETKNVVMKAKGGSLIVNVYHNDEPLQDATVRIQELSIEQITGIEGTVTFNNIPAGDYNVDVTAVGYQDQTKPITITAGVGDMLIFEMIPE